MPTRSGRRVVLAVVLAMGWLGACEDPSERRAERGAVGGEAARTTATSAGNEPIALRLNGREVRVRCELACEPLDAELERIFDGCRADPLRAPHLVSVGGASLAALGCCTEAEEAYRQACGLEGELSRCGTEWAARCAGRDT